MLRSREHPLGWIVEHLADKQGYMEKPMFGCLACYLHGRLMLVLSSNEEPWNGLLIPTEKQNHGSIIEDFGGLVPHPVLGKWLFLPDTNDDFEEIATGIAEAVLLNDMRFGVEPKASLKKKGLKGSKGPKPVKGKGGRKR